MKFGMFYAHQLPRPWQPDSEHQLIKDALEQVELADKLGMDCVWEVEHHFLEEYSHSSAPEVFLAACSQRTNRIRLGHGIVQIPFNFNHPARVVERINTLDLVSDGRVEFGTGESSSAAELEGFLVPREEKRDQWTEALDVITRMFVEEPFAGYQGKYRTSPTSGRNSRGSARCSASTAASGPRPATRSPPRWCSRERGRCGAPSGRRIRSAT